MTMHLPDVNFWLALAFDAHSHHASAKAWIDGLSGATTFFCRVTQHGFLRLANNPRAFPTDAVSMTVAWQLYDTLLTDSRVSFANEPAGLEPLWRNHTAGQQFAPKLWTDAYLAAFAQSGGYEIVTFDTGFSQFQGLSHTILK